MARRLLTSKLLVGGGVRVPGDGLIARLLVHMASAGRGIKKARLGVIALYSTQAPIFRRLIALQKPAFRRQPLLPFGQPTVDDARYIVDSHSRGRRFAARRHSAILAVAGPVSLRTIKKVWRTAESTHTPWALIACLLGMCIYLAFI
jgi:hypothetical protein